MPLRQSCWLRPGPGEPTSGALDRPPHGGDLGWDTMSSSHAVRQFWRRTARYLELGYDRLAAGSFVADLVCTSGGPVLDIGTGHGVLAMALARRGLRVISGDSSSENHAVAASLATEAGVHHRARFLLLDGVRLPFGDGCFAAAAMMDVLHHVDNVEPLLAELARVVGPEGTVVMADFSDAGFDLVSRVHRESGGEHARSAVTMNAACATLESLGWQMQRREHRHFHDAACLIRGRGIPGLQGGCRE